MTDDDPQRNVDEDQEPTETDVDISPEEVAEDVDTDGSWHEEEEEEEEFDAQEEGVQEAKRVLNSSSETDEVDRADDAISEKQESLQSLSQQYQQLQPQVNQAEVRIEGLEHTVDELQAADDDDLVLRSLEGGVVIEVDPEDRTEVLSDVRDTLEETRKNKTQMEEQLDSIERGLEKNQAAIAHLQSYREMVSDD